MAGPAVAFVAIAPTENAAAAATAGDAAAAAADDASLRAGADGNAGASGSHEVVGDAVVDCPAAAFDSANDRTVASASGFAVNVAAPIRQEVID